MKRFVFPIVTALLLVGCLWLYQFRKPDGNEKVKPIHYQASQRPANSALAPALESNIVVESSQAQIQRNAPNKTREELIIELSSFHRTPPFEIARHFSAEDEVALLNRFRTLKRPKERLGIAWVLANVGGDETVEVFIDSITKEFRGKAISSETDQSDEDAVGSLILAMGFIANRHEKAMTFLKSGVTPEFWKKKIEWKPVSKSDTYWMFAGQSIASLGISGREEIAGFLDQIRQNPPAETEGSVVDAAFYLNMRKTRKGHKFYEWFLNRATDEFDSDGTYRSWKGTAEGAKWLQWYESRNSR